MIHSLKCLFLHCLLLCLHSELTDLVFTVVINKKGDNTVQEDCLWQKTRVNIWLCVLYSCCQKQHYSYTETPSHHTCTQQRIRQELETSKCCTHPD